jgi:hypothetical protein
MTTENAEDIVQEMLDLSDCGNNYRSAVEALLDLVKVLRAELSQIEKDWKADADSLRKTLDENMLLRGENIVFKTERDQFEKFVNEAREELQRLRKDARVVEALREMIKPIKPPTSEEDFFADVQRSAEAARKMKAREPFVRKLVEASNALRRLEESGPSSHLDYGKELDDVVNAAHALAGWKS